MNSYCTSKEMAERHLEKLMQVTDFPPCKDYPELPDLIKSAKSAPNPYMFIGKALSDMEFSFNGIVYREDLREYLLSIGCDQNETFRLSEIVRKGMFKRSDIRDKLPAPFCAWAEGVRYLPPRSIFRTEFLELLAQFETN